jgi:hypothetical protein
VPSSFEKKFIVGLEHSPPTPLFTKFGSQSQLAPSFMNIFHTGHGFKDTENVQKNVSPSSGVSLGNRVIKCQGSNQMFVLI